MQGAPVEPRSSLRDWPGWLSRWWTGAWRAPPSGEGPRPLAAQPSRSDPDLIAAPLLHAAGAPAAVDVDADRSPTGAAVTEPLAGTVYLLPISHLDTQWRWTVRETAARLLPRTVRENVAAFAAFPSYRVNFDGAFRYRLLAEHHPQAFAELRRWVDAGRWCVTGATWDAMDVNLPGVESLVRQVLYGRRWFRRHLGRDPRDLFLPDCFGFGAQVPVVAAHCGLVGFATSKLRRFGDMRSAFGIPFPLGWWEGCDGSRLLAALDPGGYGEELAVSPADDPEVCAQLRRNLRSIGRGVAVRFFGIGDRGGAPDRRSLVTLERAVGSAGAVATRAAGSDETFRTLAAELPAAKLPVWRGELLLSLHGTGCYTSQVAMKAWNARNERLAAAAERAATAAAAIGAAPYPAGRLRDAWRRFLWHQFHDDLTGTSIPAAYRISWHDEAIAASIFASVLRGAVAAVARALDTSAAGVPLVVFNPVARRRRASVVARVPWGGGAAVAVIGPDGEAVPAQLEAGTGAAATAPGLIPIASDAAAGTAVVRFLAELPALGFAVFDVREQTATPAVADPELRLLPRGLESGRYRLLLDEAGNLASLLDKALDRELLAAPLRLELFADRSPRFPAWEVRWQDLERGPVATVGGPAQVRALASGPAAVAIEVRRQLGRSTFVERYRLTAAPGSAGSIGAGEAELDAPLALDVATRWRHRGHLLKLTLTAAAGAADATYDAGVAGVARGTSGPSLYEVPAQGWADLTEEGGSWGMAMVVDRAGGWDHPAKNVLRRTLVRTPATGRRFPHQGFQDLGDHRWELALAAHHGDWRGGNVPAMGEQLRQPPLAFVVESPGTDGPLGRSWSFLAVDGGELAALKEHEDGGEWVARLLDPAGAGGEARLRFAGSVATCRLLDGCEDPLAGTAATTDGVVVLDRPAFRPVTVGVRLAPPRALPAPRSAGLDLPLDRRVVAANGELAAHGFGRRRLAFPAERWPTELVVEGTPFALAAATADAHALACAGQRLPLPPGRWDRLWLLATGGGDEEELRAPLTVGGVFSTVRVPGATAALAREDEVARFGLGPLALWRVRRGRTLAATVAWTVDHAHDRRGRDVAYTPLSLFALALPLTEGAGEVVLPAAPQLLVFAATVTSNAGSVDFAGDEEGMEAARAALEAPS